MRGRLYRIYEVKTESYKNIIWGPTCGHFEAAEVNHQYENGYTTL
jgi:hypothetical protein